MVFQNIQGGIEARMKHQKAGTFWQPDILLSAVVDEDVWNVSIENGQRVMTVSAKEE